MKLYTEEQVMLAYTIGNNDGLNGILKLYTKELLLTPIELPSDEEIEKESDRYWAPHAFREGAKWVIEQIKNNAR